jgi:ribosomal protein L11 methyltransferase
MSWIEVRATFDPTSGDLSPYIDIYRQHGIENTHEEDGALIGCLPRTPASAGVIEALETDLRRSGALKVSSRDLPEENWDEMWRRHFKPHRVGRRLVVRPSWEEFDEQPDDVVIVLDPGQAFGTGDHSSTKMCLEMLESSHLAG